MPSSTRSNSWLEPNGLIGIAGFAMAVYGGYSSFQKDTTADVAALSTRVAVLEARVAYLEVRR